MGRYISLDSPWPRSDHRQQRQKMRQTIHSGAHFYSNGALIDNIGLFFALDIGSGIVCRWNKQWKEQKKSDPPVISDWTMLLEWLQSHTEIIFQK